MSYHTDCESCGEKISAAFRYCPWCSTEQKRAAETIKQMRQQQTKQ